MVGPPHSSYSHLHPGTTSKKGGTPDIAGRTSVKRPRRLAPRMARRQVAKAILASCRSELLKRRDDVGAAIARRADTLKKELKSLGEDYKEVGRIAIFGKKRGPKPGGKVAVK